MSPAGQQQGRCRRTREFGYALPTRGGACGQFDMGVQYKFNDDLLTNCS